LATTPRTTKGLTMTDKSSIKRLLIQVPSCNKCGGNMIESKAIEQTFTGTPDFIGDNHVCTVSAGGQGKLIDWIKCEKCGWSVKCQIKY